jgi:glycosyltransferase involved in cell wall biosynthesis
MKRNREISSETERLVSVIVPNFNYGRYLSYCIESIINQTYKWIELIFVDDGSSDDSLLVAERYSGQMTILKQENLGVNSARNLGLAKSRGKLIALCDSDDYWEPTKIEKQVKLLQSKPNLVLVGTSVRYFSSENLELGIGLASREGDLAKLYKLHPGVAWIPNAPSSALFYRSAALSAGSFDPELRGNAEDWEFFARLSQFGHFASVDEVLINVRVHKDSRSRVNLARWYFDNLRALRKLKAKIADFTILNYMISRLNLDFSFAKTLVLRSSLYKLINRERVSHNSN